MQKAMALCRPFRPFWFAVCHLILISLCLPSAARSQALDSAVARPESAEMKSALAAFESELEFLHDYLGLAGLAVGISDGPELSWFKGLGYADLAGKTPVTPDTPFHLASLTKTFAATLLLQLVQKGRLDLDRSASAFGIDTGGDGRVTVRHIFSHTSDGRPGDRYRYDGSRFAQLDKVIEHVTGKPFGAVLAEEILVPLNLRNTGRADDSLSTPLASPYRLDAADRLVPGAYKTYFGSSAGMVSSVSDYALYVDALLTHRFLSPETLAQAFSPTVSNSGTALPYGLGWFVEFRDDTKIVWHYGYWDSVSTLVVIVPDRDLTLIAFANTDALSRGFRLDEGKLMRSPIGSVFLDLFVFGAQ